MRNNPEPDSTVPIDKICDMYVWRNVNTRARLRRYLYLPVGLVLVLFRLSAILLMSLAASAMPSRVKPALYRTLLWILNIRVRCPMSLRQVAAHTDGCVIASNHISVFDHYPVLAMPHATLIVVRTDSLLGKLTGHLLFQCSGARYWKIADKRQLARRLRQWRRSPLGTTLYTTPEATINNGLGLFRFRPEFLVRGLPVVPLAMRLKAPLSLNPNPLHGAGPMKFLRLLSMPWLEFELNFLDRQVPAPGQPDQAFADQVQACIAQQLQIPATQWTREDKYRFRNEQGLRG